VGPGATVVDNSKNNLQLGDFKLEASAEYRFGLYKWFKGALFVDAGNVWNIRKLPSQPDAEFELSDFYKEIAVGAGAGVRADFQFFVIRFDVGFKLYDPSFPVEDRWRISKYQENFRLPKEQRYSIYNINLAIGYPF
jgi:outer membrane protein assembly factor BamA